MINKIELSAALSALATNSSIDKVTGTLSGAASNISTADLATVVAGILSQGKIDSTTVDSTIKTGIYVHDGALMTGGGQGTLLVLGSTLWSYVAQYDVCMNNAMFYRFGYGHGSRWGEWRKVTTTTIE